MPRQGAYPTLLWTDNGNREIQPLYLSPTRYFKLKVFMIKNHNNARHLENIILISLRINFIILSLTR